MGAGGTKALVTLVAVVLGSACVGPFSELKERQYPTATAARASDPSGWIPDILPDDATGIREVHKVDVSRTWGCFITRRPDAVRVLLSRIHAHEAPGPIGTRPAELFRDFSWWPESISAGSVEAWEGSEAAACAACLPTTIRIGIDTASGTVCFHRKQ
jgi:hypothetical protein